MTCPVCDSETHVYDSRTKLDSVYRRRKCLSCDYKFTTIEIDRDFYENLIDLKDKFLCELNSDFQRVVDDAMERVRTGIKGVYGLQNGG